MLPAAVRAALWRKFGYLVLVMNPGCPVVGGGRRHRSAGYLLVLLGFLVVSEVVVDQRTQPVRFGVMVWEQFNAPIHVDQGVLPIRSRQLGECNRTVAVAHGVIGVQFYRTGGVLDALLGLGCRRNRVGVGAAAPESGVGRVEFNWRTAFCVADKFVVRICCLPSGR